MDLIGPFEMISRRNQHTLTIVCMLTKLHFGCTLVDKSADTVVNAYFKEIYCRFRGSLNILSDNGREFKYSLFSDVAS